MSKIALFLLLDLFFCVQLLAQESHVDVITLKNGDIYRGKIVLQTDDIIIFKTADGRRYQFQIHEIKEIGKGTVVGKTEEDLGEQAKGNFGTMLDVNGGFAFAPAIQIGSSPIMNVSFALGSRKAFATNAFVGIGAGYETIFGSEAINNLSYLPLFLQTQIPLDNKKINPAIVSKAGYKFALNNRYKGGVFFNLSGGLDYNVTKNFSFFVGLFGQIQKISGTVIETNELGKFSKPGNALIHSTGLKAAFMF